MTKKQRKKNEFPVELQEKLIYAIQKSDNILFIMAKKQALTDLSLMRHDGRTMEEIKSEVNEKYIRAIEKSTSETATQTRELCAMSQTELNEIFKENGIEIEKYEETEEREEEFQLSEEIFLEPPA